MSQAFSFTLKGTSMLAPDNSFKVKLKAWEKTDNMYLSYFWSNFQFNINRY